MQHGYRFTAITQSINIREWFATRRFLCYWRVHVYTSITLCGMVAWSRIVLDKHINSVVLRRMIDEWYRIPLMMSHERHDVSNHRQLNCVFTSMIRLTTNINKALLTHCEEIQAVTSNFPHSNLVIVTPVMMSSWCYIRLRILRQLLIIFRLCF